MWMKWPKTVILAFLVLIGGNVFGQQRSPIDLVLVLDTSSGMSRYYSQINHYLTGSFLQDNLRLGDTFHLIAFSNEPRVEIARRIEGRGDLETIIGRMLLMYPLEPQADIPAALSFLEDYAENLNSSRQRKIIILSLGEGTAVTAESFPRLLEETRRQLGGGLEHINPAGLPLPSARPAVVTPAPRTEVPSVPAPRQEQSPAPRVDPAPSPAPPRPSAVTPSPRTEVPSVPAPRQEQPPAPRVDPAPSPAPPRPAVVTPAPRTEAPSVPVPRQEQPSVPEPEPLPPVPISEPAAPIPPPVSEPEPQPIPESPPEPAPEPSEESITGPVPVSPVTPENIPRRTERPVREGSGRVVIFILLGLLGLALLGLGAFFLIRRLHESPNRAVARAARGRDNRQSRTNRSGDGSPGKSPRKDPQIRTKTPSRNISGTVESPASRAAEPYQPPRRKSPYTDNYKPAQKIEYGSPFMLKLFVADQNTLIGKRNTHLVKPGFTYTMGGGKSDFLIFLVPVPPRLGEFKYESSGCTFYPRKPAYFPDIGNNPVHDCIGKNIRLISDRGYEILIRLEQHEDPLLELNRLMLSINVPNPAGLRPSG